MMAKKRAYAVQLVITGKDLVSSVLGKVGRGVRALVGGPLRGLAAMGRLLGSAASGIGGLVEKVPGLSLLGYGVASLVGHVRDLAVSASDAGSVFNDLGVQTGIGTRALQEVAYAADQAGVPLEQFRAGLQKMTATLGRGVKASQLQMLGRGARGFVKALKEAPTAGDKFELVLAQMAAISDTSQRAAFGMAFFGDAGVRLAAVAGDGADGIKRLRREAHELGLVMDEDAIARADEFGDTWGALSKTLTGAKRDFGTGLIEGLLPGLQELLGYTKSNRKEMGALIRDLGKKVGTGIIDAAKWVIKAVDWIVTHKGDIIDVAKKVGIALAALAGLKVLGTAGGLLGGVAGLLGGGGGAVAGGKGGLGGLLSGLLGGWKAGLVALAGGVVYMMGKAISDLMNTRPRTAQEVREDVLVGAGNGLGPLNEFGRQDRLNIATLGGALGFLAQAPGNTRQLTKQESEAALLYGRVPVGSPTSVESMTPEQRARHDAYQSAAGFTGTYAGLDALAAAEQKLKLELDVKVTGAAAEQVTVTPKLPADVEAKVTRNTGKRTMEHLP